MKIYTYSGCSTCKKATRWLDAQGIAYEERPIRERPPTRAELKAMLGYVGGERRRLFNVSGQDYRALGLKDTLPTMSDAEALKLLASNGNLVKRPFLLGDGYGLVGFKQEEWAAALAR